MVKFTSEQLVRYARNILVPGIGQSGQEKLAHSRVCVVGLGGLGSPVCFYLAAAGVGTLGLIDSDKVELSNLQRQILHTTARIGVPKTDSAEESLRALNPDVRIEKHVVRVTRESAERLLNSYDAIIEATDNFESKFIVNDACLEIKKPFATAGILGLSGHAMFVVPGQTPCLRCVFQSIPQGTPTTAEQGVLGAVPGILGSVQALEVIRWITGMWAPLPDASGRLHGVDGTAMTLRTIRVPRLTTCGCAKIKVVS